MIIIAELSYPPESSKDIGKIFLKLAKLPEFMKMRGPYVRGEIGKGISALTLYECDNAKLAEGMNVVRNRMVAYYDVRGFTYSIRVWAEAVEALKSLGLG